MDRRLQTEEKVSHGKERVPLLKASLDKHKAHPKNVIKLNTKYVILYSDGRKVEKLKEADEEFVLHKYKAECGKQYHRLSFFLCPEVDYSLASI